MTDNVAKIDGRRTDTRDRLLDTAESLFSLHGYDAVSVRDIATGANSGLAHVTYHFRTKDALFERVLERRADPLNRLRQEALVRALAQDSPSTTSVIAAFVEPYLRFAGGGDAGWRNYCRLIAIVAPDTRWAPLLARLFDDTARRFLSAIRDVEPRLDEEGATRAFLFCVGAMVTTFSGNARLDRLTEGRASASDFKRTYSYLVPFLAGGVDAIASTRPAAAKPRKARR